MAEREPAEFPDRADLERPGDLAWIEDHLYALSLVAQFGYESEGRGAIVMETPSAPPEEDPAIVYLDQIAIEHRGDENSRRMVEAYDPSGEFMTVFFKHPDRVSSYRVAVITEDETREELGRRVEPEQNEEHPAETPLEPPDLETLKRWEAEGGCEAACPHQCWVETDGECVHGNPSWLRVLGLI